MGQDTQKRSAIPRSIRTIPLILLGLCAVATVAQASTQTDFRSFLDEEYRKHYDYEEGLERLRQYDREGLSIEDRLSYDLFEWYLEDQAFIRVLAMGDLEASDVPYEAWLRHYTTTEYSADEIFRILSIQVEENAARVAELFEEISIPGSTMAGRMAVVAQIGREKTAEAGMAVFDEMQAYVDAAAEDLKPYFDRYPTDPIVVTPVPGLLSAAGMRMGSEAQGRPNQVQIRPGPDGVPYYLRMTIAHHEAYPGHYLQESIQQQLTDLPEFRRKGGFTAYNESWALYGEQLAWDVGRYEGADPLHVLGFVESKLWRSTKALTDVGLNGMGWSPEDARAFLVERLGVGDAQAGQIVASMIENPGAATASYMGYVSCIMFRERMRTELGDDFRLLDYHRVVVENGPMPMEILERVVDQYLETCRSEEKQGAK